MSPGKYNDRYRDSGKSATELVNLAGWQDFAQNSLLSSDIISRHCCIRAV